jgi:hypothetical protein
MTSKVDAVRTIVDVREGRPQEASFTVLSDV